MKSRDGRAFPRRSAPRRLGGAPVRAQPDRPRLTSETRRQAERSRPSLPPRNGAANAALRPTGVPWPHASADGIVRLWEAATWTVRAESAGTGTGSRPWRLGPDDRLFTGGSTPRLGGRPAATGPGQGTPRCVGGLTAADGKAGSRRKADSSRSPARRSNGLRPGHARRCAGPGPREGPDRGSLTVASSPIATGRRRTSRSTGRSRRPPLREVVAKPPRSRPASAEGLLRG